MSGYLMIEGILDFLKWRRGDLAVNLSRTGIFLKSFAIERVGMLAR